MRILLILIYQKYFDLKTQKSFFNYGVKKRKKFEVYKNQKELAIYIAYNNIKINDND